MARLPGAVAVGVAHALAHAFTVGELMRLARFRLDFHLDREVSPKAAPPRVARKLTEWAERFDRDADLLRVAAQARPNNVTLQELYQRAGMAVPVAVRESGTEVVRGVLDVGSGLHTALTARLPAVELSRLVERLARVEAQVCMVTINSNAAGTGFLVGPQVVLTNYHVLDRVIDGRVAVGDVQCVFDFKRLPDGSFSETPVGLHIDWLLDSSPPTAAEYGAAYKPELVAGTQPTMDELDYALIRLAQPVGSPDQRGCIHLPRSAPAVADQSALYIPQHPGRTPLMLAIDSHAIDRGFPGGLRWFNANRTRLRYSANTDPGASGSPCFDHDWNLIALHHYGHRHRVGYNQGVPIEAVWDRVKRDKQIVARLTSVVA